MLQQILKDMFIDPEILEELSEDQKQILFFKMREEQIRRWKVWDEKSLADETANPRAPKPPGPKGSRSVHFNKEGSDEKLVVEVIVEPDEDGVIARQAEEALKKRAEEKAKKESEDKRKKLEEIARKEKEDALRREEEEKLRKEAERLKKEREAEERRKAEEREAEERRRAEEAKAMEAEVERMRISHMEEENRLKEEGERRQAEEKERRRIQEKQEAEEKRRLEEVKVAEERRRAEELRRLEEEKFLREEAEQTRREEALAEEERQRKDEIYRLMQAAEEESRREDEEEEKRLEEDWKEREKKAKEAEKQRRTSFTASKREFERMRKLEKERAELEKMRKKDDTSTNNNNAKSSCKDEPATASCIGGIKNSKTSYSPNPSPKGSPSKTRRSLPKATKPTVPARLLDTRPTISNPVTLSTTRDEVDTIQIKKELVKPSRPPPPPSATATTTSSDNDCTATRKDSKSNRPPRPKSKAEVIKWYRETEYPKSSGLDTDSNAMEWFHGVITRQESERLLSNKKRGAFLVRVSERVWGYTISYKDIGRCKHFLVDTIHGGYQFFGMDQLVHRGLNELIAHHKVHPISGLGKEVLLHACGQERDPPDYDNLLLDSTTYNI